MSSEKRKPNWTLSIKEGERWHDIGAAWETEKGNLFLKVNEGETLQGVAMLFPYRDKSAGGGWHKKAYRSPAKPYHPPSPPAESENDPLDVEPPEWLS